MNGNWHPLARKEVVFLSQFPVSCCLLKPIRRSKNERVPEKYKDGKGWKTGPWFIKYPMGRDPLTGKIKYKIEKVGDFKKLAERAYQKKMVEWAEKKYLDIKEESNMTFSQLVKWYLELPGMRQNKTFKHIERACRFLAEFFGDILVWKIKPSMVEMYQRQRLQGITRLGRPRCNASVNREITVLKRVFNLAIREELADKNPCWKIKMLPENNVRDRILSPEELERLILHLPMHAALIVRFAFWTGMRAGEIFNLTWDKVDLKKKAIKLEAADTKTSEPRVIFLNGEILEIIGEAGKVRGLGHNRVFTYKGQPMASIKTCLRQACKKAGIDNLRFHDLRHTFNTNMRKAGVAPSVIMKMAGHKTLSMFNRYNTVDFGDAREAYCKLERVPGTERAIGKPR
jgi:integrase